MSEKENYSGNVDNSSLVMLSLFFFLPLSWKCFFFFKEKMGDGGV